jgi:prophage maintenance system killer protein
MTIPSQPAPLESAVRSSINNRLYNNQTDIFALAAEYAYRIIVNHPYEDRN